MDVIKYIIYLRSIDFFLFPNYFNAFVSSKLFVVVLLIFFSLFTSVFPFRVFFWCMVILACLLTLSVVTNNLEVLRLWIVLLNHGFFFWVHLV